MICLYCSKNAVAKQMCMTHYRRFLRNGNINLKINKNTTFCSKCGKICNKYISGKCQSCYYKDYRNKNTSFQYLKRLEYLEKDVDKDYLNYNLNLKLSIIKQIDIKTARNFIQKYEYMGKLSAINLFCFGIFFKHQINVDYILGGAIVFGNEYSENLGVWDKYDYTGKIILLNRGACAYWTPKNTASKLIMSSIKLLPEKYKIITATVDKKAGEIGTIYQACNFVYVGQMRKIKSRMGIKINGKIYNSLSIRRKFGTMKKQKLLEINPDIIFLEMEAKARYFYFRCSKKDIKYYRNKIKHLISKYPKRTTKKLPLDKVVQKCYNASKQYG